MSGKNTLANAYYQKLSDNKHLQEYQMQCRVKYCSIFTGVTVKIRPEIIESPQATAGQLYSPASLTCRAIGSPTPSTHWYKDNKLIANNDPDLSMLVFTELILNDRGFYHCEARNIIDGKNISVNSSTILLNITSKNKILFFE